MNKQFSIDNFAALPARSAGPFSVFVVRRNFRLASSLFIVEKAEIEYQPFSYK